MSKIRSLLLHILKYRKTIGIFLVINIVLLWNIVILKAQDTYTNDCWLIMDENSIYKDYGIFKKEDILRSFNKLKAYCDGLKNSDLEKKYDTNIPWYVWIIDYLLFVWENKLLGTADKLWLQNDPSWTLYYNRKKENQISTTWDVPAKLFEEYNNIRLPLEKWHVIWVRYVWSSWLQSKFIALCDNIYAITSQWNIWSRWWSVASNYVTKKNDCKRYISSLLNKEINIVDNTLEVGKNNIQNNISLWINKYNNQSTNQLINSLQNIKNKYMDSVMKIKSAWDITVCKW